MTNTRLPYGDAIRWFLSGYPIGTLSPEMFRGWESAWTFFALAPVKAGVR